MNYPAGDSRVMRIIKLNRGPGRKPGYCRDSFIPEESRLMNPGFIFYWLDHSAVTINGSEISVIKMLYVVFVFQATVESGIFLSSKSKSISLLLRFQALTR